MRKIHETALLVFCATIVFVFAVADDDDLEKRYMDFEVIPDVIDKTPMSLLQVTFNDKDVGFADELKPREVKDEPQLGWQLDSTKLYTLLLTDPDAPSREDKKYREVLHWAVVNIPGNDFSKGETLADYMSSGPPEGTGLHRYVFAVYEQPSKLDVDEKHIDKTRVPERLSFSSKKFTEKYNLGLIVAGNMYQAQFDDYVPELYETFKWE
ncbi:hypothetical protein TKK_0017819 [Trichogramma kaykai]|uniref:Phosphatidylethanolamine-binding protein n=1 Tax=Trichogramma kaykai TaxID=54128 RepID=A0ABD2W1C6_9HYME